MHYRNREQSWKQAGRPLLKREDSRSCRVRAVPPTSWPTEHRRCQYARSGTAAVPVQHLPVMETHAKPSFIANSSSHLLATVIPEATGYCDEENLYLAIPVFGLHQYWNLYLGAKLLNRHTALTNGYLAASNSTHLVLQIPLFAVGVIYEVRELRNSLL